MILPSPAAWSALNNSKPRSGIPVGVAVITDGGATYSGCNIELEFRLGLHAEVNALSSMLASEPGAIPAMILIAANRPVFGPCGGCLDWIMQLNRECIVVHEMRPGRIASRRLAQDYSPYYPSVAVPRLQGCVTATHVGREHLL